MSVVSAPFWHASGTTQRSIRGAQRSPKRCQVCPDNQLANLLVEVLAIICLQSTFRLSVTVLGLRLNLFPVRPGRPLSGLVVVRLSGQPDCAIGHAIISKPGLMGSTQGADRAPRVQSPRELPLLVGRWPVLSWSGDRIYRLGVQNA